MNATSLFYKKKPRIPPLIVLMEDSGFACKAVTILIYKVIIACFFNMQAFPKKYFYLFFTLLIHLKKFTKSKKKTCFLLLFISKIEMLNF